MTPAEKAARLAAYSDALAMLQHHASICTDAQALYLDLDTSIRRRVAEVEAERPADAPGKGKGK